MSKLSIYRLSNRLETLEAPIRARSQKKHEGERYEQYLADMNAYVEEVRVFHNSEARRELEKAKREEVQAYVNYSRCFEDESACPLKHPYEKRIKRRDPKWERFLDELRKAND